MSNETTNTAVPKLRFPEFRNELAWREEPLAKNLHEHKLKSDGKSEVYSVSVHKGVINQVEHLGRSFAAANTSNYSLVKPFDVIYTKSPTGDFPYGIVKQNLTGRTVLVSPLYGVFAPVNQHLGYLIHAYFEHRSRLNNYLASLVQKGAKNTIQISNDRFLSKGMYLPHDEKEQQKIAACLSSLDDTITAQTARLVALQSHKRGLMRGLFPVEGETVPNLRFPEFQNIDEWYEGELGEICTIASGGTPNRAKSEYWNGNIPWVTTSLVDFDTINFANEYITEAGLQNSSARIFPKNTILMAMYGQGKTRGQVAILGIEAATNQACAAILLHKGFDTNFVFHNLAAHYREIRELSNQGGQENLSATLIKTIPFAYPRIEEQQKIAACLSSLDNRITAQSHKIEALKLHKEGLMQGLFPAAEPTV